MTKKPTITTLQSGFNSTETLNSNFEKLRDAFDNTLSLDGSTPNAMEADLDLNGNNIIGASGLLINGTDYLADVEAAKAAALAAQAAAETAETNAETAETNAETSETAAGLSATAAATSATASAASAVDATNNGAAQVVLAAAQVTLAETAKTGAELAETNAETAESNASISATNAATSETNASTSASTASTKASEAANSATNAATSATEAETAKTAAEAARDSALAALDSFDDRYLGLKTSDPTVDNDGDALIVGALYFNSNTDLLYVYNGTSWQVTANAASGDLVSTNNLSDLTSASAARTNLGLGTAATTASTDYATAAQGSLADSAIQPNDSPTFAGLTTTGDVSFGDNDKAIFGAGSDLQIYHDGSNSYIKDAGTGNLNIQANQLRIQTDTGENFIECVPNAQVVLRYDNAVKMQTTSTGIDVTGTVTADGLTVDGSAQVRGNLPYFFLVENDTTDLNTGFRGGDGQLQIRSFGDNLSTSTNRFALNHSTGDISFYEDTGTTPKFFWDASAESLGIGTSSPSSALTVQSDSGALFSDAVGSRFIEIVPPQTANSFVGEIGTRSSHPLVFNTVGTERMRIDSSGNVGIGTTSPSHLLDVEGSGDVSMRIGSTGTGDADAFLHVDAGDTGESAVYFETDGTLGAYVSMTGGAGGDFNIGTAAASERNIDFQPNNSLAMRIVPSGNVAIGKSSPATALDVDGTVTATSFAGDGSALTGINAGAGSVEAWVNFNGVGTIAIRADGNVSSLTDNGTGRYTITFSTAISSANYAPHTDYGDDNGSRTTGMTAYEQPLTTSNDVYCATGGGSAVDRPFYSYSLVL